MLACLTLDSVQQEKVEDVLQHLRKNLYGLQRRVGLSFPILSKVRNIQVQMPSIRT